MDRFTWASASKRFSLALPTTDRRKGRGRHSMVIRRPFWDRAFLGEHSRFAALLNSAGPDLYRLKCWAITTTP